MAYLVQGEELNMIQGDKQNQWMIAQPNQNKALLKYENEFRWKYEGMGSSVWQGTTEVADDVKIDDTTYTIYQNNSGNIYIGRPGGKKRRVINVSFKLPNHPGAAKSRQEPTARSQRGDACVAEARDGAPYSK